MGNAFFAEEHNLVVGLTPASDRYNTDPATDVVNMRDYDRVTFILHQNAATASSNGTAVVTVEACSSAAGSGATAIPFRYAKIASPNTDGALTAATASGFTTTAAEDAIYLIEVLASEMEANDAGNPFVRLQLTEGTDAAVVAGVVIVLSGGPKRASGSHASAIA